MNYVKKKIIHLISFNLSPNNYATSRGMILTDVFKTDPFAILIRRVTGQQLPHFIKVFF